MERWSRVREEISSQMRGALAKRRPTSLHWQRCGGHYYGSLWRWMSFDTRSVEGGFCHHCEPSCWDHQH
ncbi:unnamed protein product [Linum tenue]|uniref:Uncharacterized protein n=1 Tax=Linum tenue TaxID=586396 RepID=A0AAV0L193_9ROSI|nr:unnamed protein product [Linum tenue]